jgi:hypothetical protein
MIFTFFKRPKPRSFNYQPMYYDPAKEEAEERNRARNGLQGGDPREHMRAEIRRRWKVDRSPVNKSAQMIRLIIFVLLTFCALYLIFFTKFINNLVSAFVR